MTHFHDADFKKALTELAPEEKSAIEKMKFGEIKNRYVFSSFSLTTQANEASLASKKAFARTWPFSKLLRSSKRRLKLLDSRMISRLVFLPRSRMVRRAKASCDGFKDFV